MIATLIISWLISDWLSSSVLSQRMHLPANWDSAAGSYLNEDWLVARRFFGFGLCKLKPFVFFVCVYIVNFKPGFSYKLEL